MTNADTTPDTSEAAASAPPHATLDVLLLTFRLQGHLSSLLATEGRDYGLNPAEVVSLINLVRGASPVSGVAAAAGIRPNGASVLVERLRSRNLVQRERSRRDNRVVTVELTEAGTQIATELIERVHDRLRFALAPLLPVERENLVALLSRLTDA